MDMKFKSLINSVEEFHNACWVHNNEQPTLLKDDVKALRAKLMREEVDEYVEAEDLTEIADALGDQLYILCGTIAMHGLQHVIVDVFTAIHESNMSKLGPDGKPCINGLNIHDPGKPIGKILKGPNYFPPTDKIKQIVGDKP